MEVQNELEDIIKDQLQHNGGISLLTLRNIDQNHLVETINQISQDLNIGQGTNITYKLSDANLDELWDKLKKKKQVLDSVSNKRSNLLDNNNSPEPKKSKNDNNSNTGADAHNYTPLSQAQKYTQQRQQNIKTIMNKTKGYWRRDYVSQVLTKNKNIVNATIVQLDIQKITDVTGMSYEEAFKLYFDPSFKSDPNEVIRTHQLAQENDNNTNNNNNNNDNNDDYEDPDLLGF